MGERQVAKLAFYGPACSGKTWSANYLVNEWYYTRVAFADKLKEIALELFGVTGKNGHDRKVLQDLGQKMREIQPNVWVNYALGTVEYIEAYRTEYFGIVLDDLRYINEADALGIEGFKFIYVSTPVDILEQRRSLLYPDTPRASYYHDSEIEWKRIVPDYTVDGSDPIKGTASLDILMMQLGVQNVKA